MDIEMNAPAAIQQLLHRYAWGYDEGKFDLLGECFDEDAVFSLEIPGGQSYDPISGRKSIVDWLSSIRTSQADQRRHLVTSMLIETLSEKKATVASYVLVTSVDRGVLTPRATGLYRDALVLDRSAWRIAARHHRLDCPF